MLRALLSWVDNSNNEDGFRVERKLSGVFVPLVTLPSGTTSYLDTTVELGTTYTYRIIVFNVIGEAISNEITATSPNVPNSPSGLQLVFTWIP